MTVSDKTAQAEGDRHGQEKFFSFAARASSKRVLIPESKARFGLFFPFLCRGLRLAKLDSQALARNTAGDLERAIRPGCWSFQVPRNDRVHLA